MANLPRRLWPFISCGVISQLTDWSYNNVVTLHLDQMSETDVKKAPKQILDKFIQDNARFANEKSSLISYARTFTDFEDALKNDTPGLLCVYSMAFAGEVDAENSVFIWRGTQPTSPHEWFFSRGTMADGGIEVPTSTVTGDEVPGSVRGASALAFVAHDDTMGSLRDQTVAALNRLDPNKTLHIAGHSMGGAMALYTALLAVKNGKFRKIRVYLMGAVKSLSRETVKYLEEHGVEMESYMIAGDVVPALDETLDLARYITGFFETSRMTYTKFQRVFQKANKGLVHPGQVYQAQMPPRWLFNPLTAHANLTYMASFYSDDVFDTYKPAKQLLDKQQVAPLQTKPPLFVEQVDTSLLMDEWDKYWSRKAK